MDVTIQKTTIKVDIGDQASQIVTVPPIAPIEITCSPSGVPEIILSALEPLVASIVMQEPLVSIIGDTSPIEVAVAPQSTNWQQLYVNFVPQTAAGMIEVCFLIQTDQIGADSYVYLAHFEGNCPSPLSMDIWYEAAPSLDSALYLTNATTTAAKVWDYSRSLVVSTNSMGSEVKNTRILTDDTQALILTK